MNFHYLIAHLKPISNFIEILLKIYYRIEQNEHLLYRKQMCVFIALPQKFLNIKYNFSGVLP